MKNRRALEATYTDGVTYSEAARIQASFHNFGRECVKFCKGAAASDCPQIYKEYVNLVGVYILIYLKFL